MSPSIRLCFAVSFSLLFASVFAFGSVTVRRVDFDRVDASIGKGDWLECAIELEVRRDASDANRLRPDYVDDLSVELMLGFESSARGQDSFEFYHSEAAPVSLKEGRHVVRFYLPPEVVERDRIGSEAHSFLIRLHRSGSLAGEFVSRQLERVQVKTSFLRRFESESSRNDGILLPQFKTPFRSAYGRDTPSFKDVGIAGNNEG